MADEENKDADREEDNEGLLGLTPDLGQRVHFAEGTQFPCREDKQKPVDLVVEEEEDEERLAKRAD
ncbi:uncharacterized protein LOC143175027 [Nomia melanderi]|uniref:uncharacterized protein LOC143175027 n=1 Tax=Nomia melanderi TaxID=2448451 RepID=UPI003FCC4521